MPHYYIWTIGCQMNKAESDRLGSLFEQRGYKETAAVAEADLILLNTCVVRQSAEDRALNRLYALRPLKKANPALTVALTGCLVDSNTAQLKKAFPYVDHFFKPGELPDWLDETVSKEPLSEKAPPAVYLPIIQGCDNFCSYCIVPYRRGREKSRPVAELVAEARELVKRGAKEITLVGQNVDSYGHDLPAYAEDSAGEPAKQGLLATTRSFSKTSPPPARSYAARAFPPSPLAERGLGGEVVKHTPDLADLLRELNGIEKLARLRFLTNHPKDMTQRLIEAIASLDKVCEQLNLPVQSGDDDILKLMRRDYTVAHYRKLIAEMRRMTPDIAISTDIIVGFPSETEEQFQHTYDLLKEVRFDAVHVAAYSPRRGTIAAKELPDDVPAEEKSRRLALIEKLQTDILTEINAGLLGKTVEILVEGRKKGKWQGRTRSGKLVFFTDSANWRGKLANIKIEKTSPWSLQGLPVTVLSRD